MRRLGALMPFVLAGMLVLAPSAYAIYGPAGGGFGADIVSVDNASDEQGNAPTVDAAISADGRYVVFQTRATNFFEGDGGVVGPHGPEPDAEPSGTLREGGIFRYDRVTGTIQLVADGTETHTEGPEKGRPVFQGAQNPSVSADGRYVAFSTAQQLVPQDKNENVDVYVRDMDVPLTANRAQSDAYTLVSAKNGGEEPASYAPREPPIPGAEPGADVWPNTSISADGRYVVFRTTELQSDLPDHRAVDTPPGELFVRDLQAKTTTLLSRNMTNAGPYPSGDPAGGALGPASVSADGSTVAWVSTNAQAQTRFLSGEETTASVPYYLWRRWQEPGESTRRITGMADPEDPECHGGVVPSEIEMGPCYGPLNVQESVLGSISGTAPGLSADGYTVAFLAGAALRPNITKSNGLDVFLTSMHPGITRKEGTRELTLGVPSGGQGSTSSIESIAFSSDASTIAFTTTRDAFVLPEPHAVGTFRPHPTASDLYVIHLGQNTLERAILSYEATDPNSSMLVDPSLTADGSAIGFASSASNLIFGDANQDPDAFVATLQTPSGSASPSSDVNSAEGGFSLASTAAPELGLHIKRGKGESLLLLVETPAAGRLIVRAHASLATKIGKRSHKKSVLVATTSGTARSEGTTTLVLRLASRYAKTLRGSRKLKASIVVGFTPISGEPLSAEASAAFTSSTARRSGNPRLAPKHRKKG